MPFQIIRNDITKVKADIIVNTANPLPMIGRGTDSAVYAAAGVDKLLAERAKIGNIERGQAAVTPAFNLSAKYIIHTVGPSWEGGSHGERDILHSCYENSLALAADLKAESIAFPLIATGVYGFPKDEALNIALSEIGKFLLTHDMKVILVVFDKGSFELSGQVASRIDEFIDEHGVGLVKKKEYGDSAYLDRRRLMIEEERRRYHFSSLSQAKPEKKEEVIYGSRPEPLGVTFADMGGKSLDEIVGDAGDTFQQRLFKLIDESGMDDVAVYSKAQIGRKVFSSIRCKKDYRPTKKTAVALSIALELDLPTMRDLLSRAGIAFSPSDTFDLVIAYHVINGIYDVLKIDAALFSYGLPTLFSDE